MAHFAERRVTEHANHLLADRAGGVEWFYAFHVSMVGGARWIGSDQGERD
jgi:hypothetical protein